MFLFIVIQSVLMVLSLVRFSVLVKEYCLMVTRMTGNRGVLFPDIVSVARIRVSGWWPLRADLKPRRETARGMIRIGLRHGPPVIFIRGLSGDDELIERIRKSAGPRHTP